MFPKFSADGHCSKGERREWHAKSWNMCIRISLPGEGYCQTVYEARSPNLSYKKSIESNCYSKRRRRDLEDVWMLGERRKRSNADEILRSLSRDGSFYTSLSQNDPTTQTSSREEFAFFFSCMCLPLKVIRCLSKTLIYPLKANPALISTGGGFRLEW